MIRPFLTKMSYQWEGKKFDEFTRDLKKLMAIILILTIIALAGAWAIGVPVLGAISNVKLAPYKSGLLYIILGGGFFAVMNLFYYVLVIMKCQRRIFFGYVPVCILSAILSFLLVKTGGIQRWGIVLYAGNAGAYDVLYGTGILRISQDEETIREDD